MSTTNEAAAVLDQQFLEIRAKLLEVGASLDRIERGKGDPAADSRWEGLRRAAEILLQSGDSRAEQIQMLFSREYEKQWRQEFGLT